MSVLSIISFENEEEYKDKIIEMNKKIKISNKKIKELENQLLNIIISNKKKLNNDLKEYFLNKELQTYIIEDFPKIEE